MQNPRTLFPTLFRAPCSTVHPRPDPHPLTLDQKMEVAYVEHVLKAKISHKLDIDQFRRKVYEKPKVR